LESSTNNYFSEKVGVSMAGCAERYPIVDGRLQRITGRSNLVLQGFSQQMTVRIFLVNSG